jgi:hypothetical protein
VTTASIHPLDANAERQHIDRVLTSRHFNKAPLLSAFLAYVCKRALEDGATRILEQEIGVKVFGREQGYDSREDNIVRNYARQLRKRLEEYYADEGRAEHLRIDIPKGGYVPSFVLNHEAVFDNETEELSTSSDEEGETPETPSSKVVNPRRLNIPILPSVICLIAVCLAVFALIERHRSSSGSGSKLHPLWSQLFFPNKDTLLVPSDTAFVTLQEIEGKTFPLAEYVSWSSISEHDSRVLADLKNRKYTSVVDLEIVSKLEHLPEAASDHYVIRSPRGLTTEDLNDGNAILIGSIYSIPWIELFQNYLNFRFVYLPGQNRSWIENRNPTSGEASTYANTWNGLSEKTYAVLAFIPNLNRTGHILILEGLDGAGTEAMENLLFRGDGLDELMRKARRPDGTLGNFEALLEATSVDSNASGIRVLAVRTPD